MRPIDADALLEQYGLKNATKYGNKNAEQQHNSYSTLMMYEIADMIYDAPTIESPRDWTPCAEGLPKKDPAKYFSDDLSVTVSFGDSANERYVDEAFYDFRTNTWESCAEHGGRLENVIAWKPQDKPWQGGLDGK